MNCFVSKRRFALQTDYNWCWSIWFPLLSVVWCSVHFTRTLATCFSYIHESCWLGCFWKVVDSWCSVAGRSRWLCFPALVCLPWRFSGSWRRCGRSSCHCYHSYFSYTWLKRLFAPVITIELSACHSCFVSYGMGCVSVLNRVARLVWSKVRCRPNARQPRIYQSWKLKALNF